MVCQALCVGLSVCWPCPDNVKSARPFAVCLYKIASLEVSSLEVVVFVAFDSLSWSRAVLPTHLIVSFGCILSSSLNSSQPWIFHMKPSIIVYANVCSRQQLALILSFLTQNRDTKAEDPEHTGM
jgi:hypothetical protein